MKFEMFAFIMKALCYITSPVVSIIAGLALWSRLNPITCLLGSCFLAWAILEPILAHDLLIQYINEVQVMNVGEKK